MLKKRPKNPKVGDEWMQPIQEIIDGWHSIDQCHPDTWEAELNEKRADSQYPDVVKCIKEHGFLRPVTCIRRESGELVYGDGHHRLAAAIDLGMTDIPIRLCKGTNGWDTDCVSDDSCDWVYGMAVEGGKNYTPIKEAVSA